MRQKIKVNNIVKTVEIKIGDEKVYLSTDEAEELSEQLNQIVKEYSKQQVYMG